MPIKHSLTIEERLATQKLADRYVRRDGGLPNVHSRAKAARSQDLNVDDRKHLQYCLKRLRRQKMDSELEACLTFIEAILDIHYHLKRGEPL
jgi:hypothetical protein